MLNCNDDFLLFLYKRILLPSETRSESVKLPRHPEAWEILKNSGITVISVNNNSEMEQRLMSLNGEINTLVLNHGKQANHADYRCNRKAGGSIEIFHEYRGTKRLYGVAQIQNLRRLVGAVEKV